MSAEPHTSRAHGAAGLSPIDNLDAQADQASGKPHAWNPGGTEGASEGPRETSSAGHRARGLGTGGACRRANRQKKSPAHFSP